MLTRDERDRKLLADIYRQFGLNGTAELLLDHPEFDSSIVRLTLAAMTAAREDQLSIDKRLFLPGGDT